MTNKFRLNQYNWLGQKLLAQHRYSEILNLGQHNWRAPSEPAAVVGLDALSGQTDHLSDHLCYLNGLALMKTQSGHRLADLIVSLQRLNFQKNNQYFLLLCQCLLYLGNHDSIVALCKQLFNKQIDAVSSSSSLDTFGDAQDSPASAEDKDDKQEANNQPHTRSSQSDWYLQRLSEESLEFKSILEIIKANKLINEPKLWFIFGLSLEFQLQFKDADLAYRVASQLTLGARKSSSCGGGDSDQDNDRGSDHEPQSALSTGNFYLPHSKYAQFLVSQKGDFKGAIKVLGQATSRTSCCSSPADYDLGPELALLMGQAGGQLAAKASELLANLDAHSVSSRNPSFAYNQLALKCKLKLLAADPNADEQPLLSFHRAVNRIGNETRCNLNYNLAKAHVALNELQAVDGQQQAGLVPFRCPNHQPASGLSSSTIDRMVDELRACDSSCWSSSSGLWNNLAVCYLVKRRYVASLACFMRAHQMNPLDWRINYNLGLAYQHVGLNHRALVALLASRAFARQTNRPFWELWGAFKRKKPSRMSTTTTSGRQVCVSTQLAVCLGELGLCQEARRVFAEMAAAAKTGGLCVSSLMLVNYLLLLLSSSLPPLSSSRPDSRSGRLTGAKDVELDLRLASRLLDQLEQMWLRRDQNDGQFPADLLGLAQSLAVQVGRLAESHAECKLSVRQTFAWTK